tara:strand:+ start:464 stop:811 length:348 start_codon:yes stop_codon:yes gene_type:complete
MITDKLKELLIANIKTHITDGQIGFGGNSTNPTSTTLDVPSGVTINGANLGEQLSDENVLEVKLSVDGSNIQGKVIREMGIFDSSGNMLARENFSGIGPFSASETLEIFYIIEVE